MGYITGSRRRLYPLGCRHPLDARLVLRETLQGYQAHERARGSPYRST